MRNLDCFISSTMRAGPDRSPNRSSELFVPDLAGTGFIVSVDACFALVAIKVVWSFSSSLPKRTVDANTKSYLKTPNLSFVKHLQGAECKSTRETYDSRENLFVAEPNVVIESFPRSRKLLVGVVIEHLKKNIGTCVNHAYRSRGILHRNVVMYMGQNSEMTNLMSQEIINGVHQFSRRINLEQEDKLE